MLFYACTFAVVLFLALLARSLSPPSLKKLSTHEHLLGRVRDILNPSGASLRELLTERALSNQRLVRALHLTNTFVSGDLEVHKQFVAHARKLLNGSQRRRWPHFRDLSDEVARWQLSLIDSDNSILPFDTSIQNITMAVVLTGLLNISDDIQSLQHRDISIAAQRITTLWALSKKADPIPPHLLTELNEHLRRLVPDEVFSNPLDFVIPAWETLWRVVAIAIAHTHDDPNARRVFQQFHADPTDTRFRTPEGSLSVHAIIAETMRLHPPSKRIGRCRSRRCWPSFLGTIVRRFWPEMMQVKEVAEVEKLLRSEAWGVDADVYRPSRHHETGSEVEGLAKVAFGYGPLKCIAASWAPMAAGVIVAAVLDQLDDERYHLEAGAEIGTRDGWAGWEIRGV